ncbi:MAG: hypothetical protein ACRCXZ_06935 [Patescibacteria group bacterium]
MIDINVDRQTMITKIQSVVSGQLSDDFIFSWVDAFLAKITTEVNSAWLHLQINPQLFVATKYFAIQAMVESSEKLPDLDFAMCMMIEAAEIAQPLLLDMMQNMTPEMRTAIAHKMVAEYNVDPTQTVWHQVINNPLYLLKS